MREHWTLYVMGCRGSFPICGREFEEFGGATSCYILKRGAHAVILDCGTGLYRAKALLADCRQIDILLTHVHYDHLMGILDWSVIPRGIEATFYAGFHGWHGQQTLTRFMGHPYWPYTPNFGRLVDVPAPGEFSMGGGVTVRTWPSTHPDEAQILRIDTEDGAVCAAFDYEHSRPFPAEMAEGCDVLLYDGMYTLAEYEAHRGWGHSCWEMGCRLARQCHVRQLLVTHHSPNKDDRSLRAMEKEARAALPGTRFARMGDVIPLGAEREEKQPEKNCN